MVSHSQHISSLEAFHAVISLYQEKVLTQRGFEPLEVRKPYLQQTSYPKPGVIVPSETDFLIDVEVCARRVLEAFELRYFNAFYRNCVLVVLEDQVLENDAALHEHIGGFEECHRELIARRDLEVRTKIGLGLIEAKIYPLSEYLAPVDTRGRARY